MVVVDDARPLPGAGPLFPGQAPPINEVETPIGRVGGPGLDHTTREGLWVGDAEGRQRSGNVNWPMVIELEAELAFRTDRRRSKATGWSRSPHLLDLSHGARPTRASIASVKRAQETAAPVSTGPTHPAADAGVFGAVLGSERQASDKEVLVLETGEEIGHVKAGVKA